ncbi:hypothetical protein IG631_24102 [Alternaria alternata]|nr:hypothetical protein IG631_24102 [Alternaria alternata]
MALTIDTSALFGGKLVSVAVQKSSNPAFEDLPLRNRAGEICYHLSLRWQTSLCFSINDSTLARRHQDKCQPHAIAHFSLHPEHETELVRYTKSLTERCTPPFRTMIRNFASSLVDKEVYGVGVWRNYFQRTHGVLGDRQGVQGKTGEREEFSSLER